MKGVFDRSCPSVCSQHRRLSWIRQRAPLLAMMQQSRYGRAFHLGPSGRYSCW